MFFPFSVDPYSFWKSVYSKKKIPSEMEPTLKGRNLYLQREMFFFLY